MRVRRRIKRMLRRIRWRIKTMLLAVMVIAVLVNVFAQFMRIRSVQVGEHIRMVYGVIPFIISLAMAFLMLQGILWFSIRKLYHPRIGPRHEVETFAVQVARGTK